MSHGDQRDDIFFDDLDRHDFIKTLPEACQKTDWPVLRSGVLRRVDKCMPSV
jgi:hypothetical protein